MKGKMKLVLVLFLVGIVVSGCPKKPKPEIIPPPVTEEPAPPPQPPVEEPVVKVEEPEIKLDLQTIYFDFDKYNIKPSEREVLIKNAEQLMAYPTVRILIEGHCDERGTNEYNMALGERRARSARDFLINYGIAGDRIDIISYGEERPVDPRHNEEAWAKNRRAEFVIKE